jgi:molybdopterin/thiamine biosynthesis adenylyltransferase
MSDLNGQIICSEKDIGERKAVVAQRRLSERNVASAPKDECWLNEAGRL